MAKIKITRRSNAGVTFVSDAGYKAVILYLDGIVSGVSLYNDNNKDSISFSQGNSIKDIILAMATELED